MGRPAARDSSGGPFAMGVVMEEKFMRIAARAEELAALGSWTRVYRETLAPCGMIGQLSTEEQAAFRKSKECAVVQEIIAEIRKRQRQEDTEPLKVITIRLPAVLHEALRQEGHQRQTSMNRLCISKLLQSIDPDLVPSDFCSEHPAR